MKERRSHPRYSANITTEVLYENNQVMPAITQDISRSGALLLMMEPLVNMETVQLKLLVDEQHTEEIEAYIIRDHYLKHGPNWGQITAVKFKETASKTFEDRIIEFSRLPEIEDEEDTAIQ